MSTELFVALDDLTTNEHKTLKVAESLMDVPGHFGFKVNLDYLLRKGLEPAVKAVQQFGRPVFTDLKMWNGTRTMIVVAEDLIGLGVDYLNVYALAGSLLSKVIAVTRGTNTKVLGVTVLTHFNQSYCWSNFHRSLRQTVQDLTATALEFGCDGVILPGTALDVVRDVCAIKVVPGIRPQWYKDDRHEEEIEPKIAVRDGATTLVCGSPIMKSSDPTDALTRVLAEIQ